MKYDLYEPILSGLKNLYGLENEDENYIYRYVYIRTAIYHDRRSIKKRDLFNFIIKELNLSIIDDPSTKLSCLYYKDEKHSLFDLSSNFLDNFLFRAEMYGDIDTKEELESIFRTGQQRVYKYRKLDSWNKYKMNSRLKMLNQEFGVTSIGPPLLDGFYYNESHNPMKRSIEEQLEAELMSDKNTKSNSTAHINEAMLEDFLIDNLNLIEDGLMFLKRQHSVQGGFVDILAKDKDDNICIIEIKINEDKAIVWQAIHYPMQVRKQYNSNVRMITISPGYSKSIFNALKSIDNIEMFNYNIVTTDEIEDLVLTKVN